jgi:type VI secretion system protein VasG
MAEISRSALFGKFNSLCYKALEGSTVFCKLRGNPYVELVHFVHQLLQSQDSDLHRIIRTFELNPTKVVADLQAALDRLPRGATSISDFSPHLADMAERGWTYASLLYGDSQLRSGYLVVGMVKTAQLKNVLSNISKEFDKIKPEKLSDDLMQIVSGSPEEHLSASDGTGMSKGAAPGEASGAMAPAQMGKQEALGKFCVDLTERARKGEMDPILGRDDEIRQIVDIVMRRRQNNPILTGEAGVGKTAVVEGFAQRIVAGDVPPSLRNVRLLSLDLGLLQAGASMKGEFENRLRQVIEEVQSSPTPIIMFIDEAHTLIGAGGAAGQNDAANLLKPALARGTLRTVAATTWAEYKKYFEKDPALTRRFQTVKVDEPDERKAILMLRGVAGMLEKHHKVQLLDEAIDSAVRLSKRYIPSRQLPDKAVSLLDTACARVAVSQHAVPAEIDDTRRAIEAMQTEQQIIGREESMGVEHTKRKQDLAAAIAAEETKLKGLEVHWGKEKELVTKILDLRSKLRTGSDKPIDKPVDAAAAKAAEAKPGDAKATDAKPSDAKVEPKLSEEERLKLLEQLKSLQGELSAMQGETPLILPSCDAQAVSSVVADWTGIPVGRMVKDEIAGVLNIDQTLGKRVIGQDHALKIIGERIATSKAKLDNPNRPIGVFMLAGPSGVGKTETALSLAESIYGGAHALITINMSEFQEPHKVATLMGSPPGYVGYGQGGVLTEAVRRRPYSVVLLDEVEKAHSDVHEVFFQVFDKGMMKDSEGIDIDFKNTLIILTTNVATDLIMSMCKDPELMPDLEGLRKAVHQEALKKFPAALLGRITLIPYYPISDKMLRAIINLQLGRVGARVKEGHGVPFEYGDEVVNLIASRCTETESGARAVDAIIVKNMLPQISREILTRMMNGERITRVRVGVNGSEFAYDF